MRRVPWGVPSGDPDGAFIRPKPMWRGLTASPHLLVTLNNFERIARPSLIACAPATYLLNVRPIKFRW